MKIAAWHTLSHLLHWSLAGLDGRLGGWSSRDDKIVIFLIRKFLCGAQKSFKSASIFGYLSLFDYHRGQTLWLIKTECNQNVSVQDMHDNLTPSRVWNVSYMGMACDQIWFWWQNYFTNYNKGILSEYLVITVHIISRFKMGMRQGPLECDINIAVNGCSGYASSTRKGPFMAMLISCSKGTCLIREVVYQRRKWYADCR